MTTVMSNNFDSHSEIGNPIPLQEEEAKNPNFEQFYFLKEKLEEKSKKIDDALSTLSQYDEEEENSPSISMDADGKVMGGCCGEEKSDFDDVTLLEKEFYPSSQKRKSTEPPLLKIKDLFPPPVPKEVKKGSDIILEEMHERKIPKDILLILTLMAYRDWLVMESVPINELERHRLHLDIIDHILSCVTDAEESSRLFNNLQFRLSSMGVVDREEFESLLHLLPIELLDEYSQKIHIRNIDDPFCRSMSTLVMESLHMIKPDDESEQFQWTKQPFSSIQWGYPRSGK